MKKMMLVAAACALVAAPSILSADTVTSVNVVGYYSVTIPNNGLALVTPVLEGLDGATIADLVGEQLPVGSNAILWNRETKSYVFGGRTRSGWSMTNVILRGDAFWLRPAADTGPHTVTFMGEVPAAYNMAQETVVDNIQGTDAVGYAYPVDIIWTNTTLAQVVPTGSNLIIWDLDSQSYTFYGKTRSGWSTPPSFEIKAGQGFWIRSTDPVDWEEEVPYTL